MESVGKKKETYETPSLIVHGSIEAITEHGGRHHHHRPPGGGLGEFS